MGLVEVSGHVAVSTRRVEVKNGFGFSRGVQDLTLSLVGQESVGVECGMSTVYLIA